MTLPGIPRVVSYPQIGDGILLIAVRVLDMLRVLHVLYKRLDGTTNAAWLFLLTAVVSALVPGQRNRNI
jgi:hypothetical protein